MNERIKEIRQMAKMTQSEFADAIKLARSYVAQIETGIRSPSDRTISDICRTFNVSEEWLRTGEGEMFKKLDRSDEIAAFVAQALSGGSLEDEAKRKWISVLSRLGPEAWKALDEIGKKLAEEYAEK